MFTFRTIVTSGLALAAAVCSSGAAAEDATKGDTLCPRGAYSIRRVDGENTLRAVVKLRTAGYKVELKEDREKAIPPSARFLCTRPSGMAAQVVTTYTATLAIPGMQHFVADAKGRRLVKMDAAVPAAKCKSNRDCRGHGEFCDTTPACGPNAPGRCVRKPEICTMQFDPVQGCDGKTYSNACKAVSEGVSVRSKTANY